MMPPHEERRVFIGLHPSLWFQNHVFVTEIPSDFVEGAQRVLTET